MFFSAELPEASSVLSLACSSGVLGFTEFKYLAAAPPTTPRRSSPCISLGLGGSIRVAGVLSDSTGDRLPSGLVTGSGREDLR